MPTQTICVFCGGSPAVESRFLALADAVGAQLARGGARVVYGGASVGMMGALAAGALSAGGRVTGVIPRSLEAREVAHRGLTDLRVVDTMHTRKKLMSDESDGFLALPGGFGTMDELFEITTWRQIGLHGKPIALLNEGGYYDPLLAWIAHAVRERFVPDAMANAIEVLSSLAAVGPWLARVPAREDDPR
jgi:uncharacterized protein (TIGR00730 family)